MSLNGISNSYSASYESKSVSASKTSVSADKNGNVSASTSAYDYNEVGVSYEVSDKAVSSASNRDAIIAHLKASTEQRMQQMQSIVSQMFEKQGIKIGTADDMWKVLASGNFTADAETIAQAKEDISEDGYWGVNKTSERIFSFALALSGGDEDTMKEMVKAVEKGFSLATKSWGKELPEISSNTRDAIWSKFDNWFEEHGSSTRVEDLIK